MTFHVPCDTMSSGIGMTTDLALKWFFTSMRYKVLLQKRFEDKAFLTNTAKEPTFSCMICNMIPPRYLEAEAFSTVGAEIGFLCRLNSFSMGHPHVIISALFGTKLLPTIRTHNLFTAFVFFVLTFMKF